MNLGMSYEESLLSKLHKERQTLCRAKAAHQKSRAPLVEEYAALAKKAGALLAQKRRGREYLEVSALISKNKAAQRPYNDAIIRIDSRLSEIKTELEAARQEAQKYNVENPDEAEAISLLREARQVIKRLCADGARLSEREQRFLDRIEVVFGEASVFDLDRRAGKRMRAIEPQLREAVNYMSSVLQNKENANE